MRASVLLKPVRPAALRPFLENAVRLTGLRRSDPNPRPVDANRDANRDMDELLDCLLHVNLRLQQYDQSRTNFLARVVHDFRAPLTALSGYCGLLIDQRLGTLNAEQIELLSRMQHSVARLSRLAGAMFELSVGPQSKSTPEFREADIEFSIRQAIHEIARHAEEKHIRLSVTIETPDRPLMFDAGQTEQVLINLLENACKFTSRHGNISVSAYPVSWSGSAGIQGQAVRGVITNAYRIDVEDSGCGIPKQHIGSIFEEYTSYAGGTDRSGGGLGLAICRMIVNAHDGSICADSSTSGTQFSFVLPYRTATGGLYAGGKPVARAAEAPQPGTTSVGA